MVTFRVTVKCSWLLFDRTVVVLGFVLLLVKFGFGIAIIILAMAMTQWIRNPVDCPRHLLSWCEIVFTNR